MRALLFILLAAAADPARAVNEYIYDDGTAETNLVWVGRPDVTYDVLCLNRFHVRPGLNVITGIRAAMGISPLPFYPYPATAYLWPDLDLDGVPDAVAPWAAVDGFFTRRAMFHVPVVRDYFEIPATVVPEGAAFWVGVSYRITGLSHLPLVAVDSSSQWATESWAAVGTPLDLSEPAGQEYEQILGGNFIISADAVPASPSVAPLALAWLALRRRCRVSA